MSGAPKEDPKKDDHAEGAKGGGGRKLVPMLGAVGVVLLLQAGLAFGIVRYLGISDQGQKKIPKSTVHGTKEGGGDEGAVGEGGEGGENADGEEGDGESSKKPQQLECADKPLTKTVTIAGTEAKRYLKASFCLEYDALKYKEFPKKIEPQMMRVEASLNKILSSATFPVVTNPRSQDSLTREMTLEVNRLLKHEKIQIHSVLVTEWLVQ